MGNFLSFLRRIIFIILVILSITMWTKGGVLLPLAIAIAAYILLLLITGIYTKLLFHKYPNKRGAFIEYLWTTDVCNFFIVHGIGNYGERLWNLWHFSTNCDLYDYRAYCITIVICISYDDGKINEEQMFAL